MARAADIIAEWNAAGAALPIATRQRFLDAIWAGLSVGQAKDRCGMSLAEALGVLDMNIVRSCHALLRREAV